MGNAAIFLDRDDTIIEDPGYINDPEQVKLLPGVTDALSQLKKMGYKLVVVTNQSAVARGMVSEEVLEEIHERLRKLLGRKRVYLDGIYYCPYHPEAVIPKYRRDSDFRKPNPGMLFQAAEELGIDLKESWMIGNSYTDVAAGVNAGCRTILIRSSANPPTKGPGDPEPNKIAVNIKEAVNIIKMFRQQMMMTPRPAATAEAAEKASAPAEPAAEPAITLPEAVASDVNSDKKNKTEETVRQPKPKARRTSSTRPRTTAKRSMIPTPPEPSERPAAATPAPQAEPIPEETVTEQKPEPAPVRAAAAAAVQPQRPIATAQAPSTASGRRFIEPRGGRPAARPSSPETSETQEVLNEVMRYLKKVDRLNMYDEFSWLKAVAGALQIVVLFPLLLSLWFLLDPTRDSSAVHTALGYAAVLQLAAIAFHLMRDRK
jgi:D-glycero-D-manno-heptose 1,7-bisphosphate phosphatase